MKLVVATVVSLSLLPSVSGESSQAIKVTREAAEELELASARPDGTLRNPVTIWVVRVGDALYVRSWKGRTGSWFRASQVRHEGHILAGGVDKDVTFVAEANDDINDQVDAAYRTEYRRHGGRWVDPHGGR